MKNNIIVNAPFLTVFTFLAACAVNDPLTETLPRLNGASMAGVLQTLGRPAAERKDGNLTTYTWTNYETGTYSVPATGLTPIIGTVGGQTGVTYSRTDMAYTEQPYSWSCHLDITARDGRVVHTQFDGTGGGCRVFDGKLKAFLAN